MSGTSVAKAERPGKDPEKKSGFFAAIALFVRQVVAELRKVITPTRSELVNFFIVVLVFVLVCMLFVFWLDFGFGRLVLWVFGGS